MMTRMIFAAVVAVLSVVPQAAAAAHPADAARATDERALGVLQQGKGGGGGKPDDGGGRGQGGGRDAQPSGERRQGGGQSARPSERGQSDRAESGRGRSSSSSSARSGNAGGRSDDVRGKGSSSASARSERGSGSGSSSASSVGERGRSADVRANATTGGSAVRASTGSGRHRLSGPQLQARIAALPQGLQRMAASSRPSERMAAGAIARGHARGVDANAFDVRSDGGRLRVLNRTGQLLLDLDDRRANDLGSWTLRRLGDRQPTGNAPAFCRSGAGHPVFGRQWCLDKGFGLGSRAGTLWSRGGIDDVIWRRPTADRLDRGGLIGVLGDVILGRLALQAITLGYDQPLVGFWVEPPEGPRLLRVHSGDYEVAEFVDDDRDDRVDVLYVVQPVW